MPFRRRRPLLRAAAVGGVGYAAGKRGAKAAGEEPDPNAPPDEQPEAATDPAPAAPSADQSMAELTKLKELLDNGVLTQAEFDAQKQKILQSM
jgi:membrane protease subunit (stomatin/prohibitin family)